MPQNEVVTLPARPGAAHSISDIEKLADAIAKSGMFGIRTRDQALVLMAIAQSEGRHPAAAARDYSIIQGRPAKTSEAMMRDFLTAGGRVEWHQLSDDIADATFAHPQGGTIRIVWDTARASQAGLASKDMWRKYPRQMLRSRCVSEGVRTVCPSATSGFYVPEEAGDIPVMSPPEPASDTTADLDQFAAITGEPEPPPMRDIIAEAREVAGGGTVLFREFWTGLSRAERDSIRQHLAEFERTAKTADDPFGLPPLEVTNPPPAETAAPPVTGGAIDVFSDLDHQARAATAEGTAGFAAWWKTLRRGDADLLRAFKPEYERIAKETDALGGLSL